MTPLAHEWVDKAEGDPATATRELGATDRPNYDAVCFHAQQCAEKYLKAILQEKRIRSPKTHDLVELALLAAAIDPSWTESSDRLELLTEFAVDLRYPGAAADKATAADAVETAREVRARARSLLGIQD